MIGNDPEKLKADSPRLHAGKIGVPVLLIHGIDDYTVEADQSEFMARALQKADKPYKLVMIDAPITISRTSRSAPVVHRDRRFLRPAARNPQ